MSASKDISSPTVENLSHLPENQNWPSYFSSMAGGNMITKKNPHFAGQGSDTEAVHDVAEAGMTDFGNIQEAPALTDEPNNDSQLSTDEKGSGYSPGSPSWEAV